MSPRDPRRENAHFNWQCCHTSIRRPPAVEVHPFRERCWLRFQHRRRRRQGGLTLGGTSLQGKVLPSRGPLVPAEAPKDQRHEGAPFQAAGKHQLRAEGILVHVYEHPGGHDGPLQPQRTALQQQLIVCCRLRKAKRAPSTKLSASHDWWFFSLHYSICSAEVEEVEGFMQEACPAFLNLQHRSIRQSTWTDRALKEGMPRTRW